MPTTRTPRTRLRGVLAVVALTLTPLAVAACGDDDDPAPATEAPATTTDDMTAETAAMTDETDEMTDETDDMTDETEAGS